MSVLQEIVYSHLEGARLGQAELRGGRLVVPVHLGNRTLLFDSREDLLRLAHAARHAVTAYDEAAWRRNNGLPIQPVPQPPAGAPRGGVHRRPPNPAASPAAGVAQPPPAAAGWPDRASGPPPPPATQPPIALSVALRTAVAEPRKQVVLNQAGGPMSPGHARTHSKARQRWVPLSGLWQSLRRRWRAEWDRTAKSPQVWT